MPEATEKRSVAPVAATATVAAEPVGNRTARGAAWTIGLAMLNKAVAFGCQIGLAWYLLPTEVGLGVLAISVTGFATAVLTGTIPKLLVQQPERYARSKGQIFWLTLTLSSVAAGVIAVGSFVFRSVLPDSTLTWLLLLAAAAMPISAFPVFYATTLYADLRFKAVAGIHLTEAMVRNTLMLTCAMAGLGAYSWVLPLVVGSGCAAITARAMTGKIALGRPEPRTWRPLVLATSWMAVFSVVGGLQLYGSTIVVGWTTPPTVSGIYFWGFNAASQLVFLLVTNLRSVFFPAFAKLNEHLDRQHNAMTNATRVLTLMLVPVCALQFFWAETGVVLLFGDRWLPAVPVIKWVSIAMLTQPGFIISSALLSARSDYRKLSVATLITAVATATAAGIGSADDSPVNIARNVCVAITASNMFFCWLGFSGSANRLVDFFGGGVTPLLVSVPVFLLGSTTQHMTFSNIYFRDALTGVVLLCVWAACLYFFFPDCIRQVRARIAAR